MTACQHLYEGGYITYPRTDSRTYSVPFLEHAGAYIAEKWGETYVKNQNNHAEELEASNNPKPDKKKRIVIKKKKVVARVADEVAVEVADVEGVKPQEAHEAVHVTSLQCTAVPDTMTAKEQRLYRMIWRHSAESCMAPCTGKTLTSCITAPEGSEYRHSVERTDFAGWLIVSNPNPDDSAVARWSFFQAIAHGTSIKYNKLQSRMHVRDLKSHYSEASLVSMLEERGIGRPSTFSSLVHKIQERGYVAKQDVPGRRASCINYELDGGILSQFVEEREFGNEKNRLVIQPLGNTVIEFLCTHFADLFEYDYTKRMEQQLDQVSSGEKQWGDVCAECLSCVDRLLITLLNSKNCDIPLSEKHAPNATNATIAPNAPNAPIKNLCKLLGKYNGTDLFLRTGRYGPYLTWGDQKQSLPHLKNSENPAIHENVEEIGFSYEEAVRYIHKDKDTIASSVSTTSPSILREINAHASVRSGQYGPYIYYKNAKMKTPAFVSLRGFKEDWKTCDLQLLDTWSTVIRTKK
jgi:DNA topoisomerase-1